MTIRATLTAITDTFGHHAFTNAEAECAGISADRLQRVHDAGLVSRLTRGVYVVPDPAPADAWHLARTRAAALRDAGTSAIIGGSAAAQRWGVPVMAGTAALPSIVAPKESGVRTGVRGGIRYLREDIDPLDLRTSAPADPVTSPVRTAIDIIRHARLDSRMAVAMMSIAQRQQIMLDASPTPQRLRSLLAETQVRADLASSARASLSRVPRRGASYVSHALDMCDPRLESVLEGLSWFDFIDAGLPLPMPQAWVQGASGRRYCVDFLWEEFGIIGEADGAVKYSTPEEVMAEKARQADLEAAGYRFVRWTWADAMGGRSYIARLSLCLGDSSPRFSIPKRGPASPDATPRRPGDR